MYILLSWSKYKCHVICRDLITGTVICRDETFILIALSFITLFLINCYKMSIRGSKMDMKEITEVINDKKFNFGLIAYTECKHRIVSLNGSQL